jgi:Rieske Fe-S protein
MTELTDPTTRRAVLGGVAAVGAGAILAACGSDEPKKEPASGGEDTSGDQGSAPSDGSIGTIDEVPVGGGTVFKTEKVVVTQPKKGDFHAFTAVCTHMGCTVGEVNGDTIQCNCHGSQYNAADGTVKKGPAPKALAAKKITVDGDKLIVS